MTKIAISSLFMIHNIHFISAKIECKYDKDFSHPEQSEESGSTSSIHPRRHVYLSELGVRDVSSMDLSNDSHQMHTVAIGHDTRARFEHFSLAVES